MGQKNDIEEKIIRIMCKNDVRALDEALLGSLGSVNSKINKKQQKMQRSVQKCIFENPNDWGWSSPIFYSFYECTSSRKHKNGIKILRFLEEGALKLKKQWKTAFLSVDNFCQNCSNQYLGCSMVKQGETEIPVCLG